MSDFASCYLTPAHACNYLPGRQAQTLVTDPQHVVDRSRYTQLVATGFRRSGSFIYRPHCKGCRACVPVRINCRDFSLRRGQRRCWQRNQDLDIEIVPAGFQEEYYHLYHHYINTRHASGGMEDPSPTDFMQFLTCDWAETLFIVMRLHGQLAAVAVVDQLDNGLSAIYTFFDPGQYRRSPGIFAILYEVDIARRRDLDWLYLGYWIDSCDKMQYKNAFNALQYFHAGHWQTAAPAAGAGSNSFAC